jgi:hypothetical protein
MKKVYICGYSLRLAGSSSPAELHENLVKKRDMINSNNRRFSETQHGIPPFGILNQAIDE